MEGSASDNRRRDADELWSAVKDIELRETEAFSKLVRGERRGNEVELKAEPTDPRLPGLTLEVRYGGTAEPKVLRIIKVESDEKASWWRIDPAHVDKLFSRRMVQRSDRETIKNPRRTK